MYRLPFVRLRHVQTCYSEYGAYVEELVAERTATGDDGNAPTDLLQALLDAHDDEKDEAEAQQSGLSSQEVLGNIYIFMLAGHGKCRPHAHACLS